MPVQGVVLVGLSASVWVGAGRQAAGRLGGCGQGSDGGEPAEEQVGPGPAGGGSQGGCAGAVDDPGGHGEQPGADGAGDGECFDWFADGGRPADEVVGQHGGLQPGGVGGEVAGGAVFEPGAFFEVSDRQFDAGVLTVEGVDLDRAAVKVGEKPEVPPVRP